MGVDYSSINFRQFIPADTTDMYLAFQDAFGDYPVPPRLTLEEFRYKFIDRMNLTFEKSVGVWDGNKLVAFIFARVFQDIIYYGGMGVRKAYRGHHLLKKLYEYHESGLLVAGIKVCQLEVLDQNRQAQQIYRNLGYRVKRNLITSQGRLVTGDIPSDYLVHRLGNEIPWADIEPWFTCPPAFMSSKAVLINGSNRDKVFCVQDHQGLGGLMVGDLINGRVSLLVIRPDLRRQGIASTLLHHFQEKAAVDLSYFLNVPEEVTEMHSLLSSCGFTQLLKQSEMEKTL